jgi:hypothetical protein
VSNRNTLHSVKELVEAPLPEVDAKPVYHNLVATVVNVNPDQAMYYLANPDTGRKVCTSACGWHITCVSEQARVCQECCKAALQSCPQVVYARRLWSSRTAASTRRVTASSVTVLCTDMCCH